MQSTIDRHLTTLFGLEGRTVIVTGAARGIGKGIAQALGAAGARVVIADLQKSTAQACAAELERAGIEAIGVETDVSDQASVERLFAVTAETFGGTDILVNNAAIFPTAPFLEISVKDWDRMHEINVRGTFLCMREAIKQMQSQRRGGSIVNLSSVNSLHPVIFDNAQYGSSKAGVNMLTKTAALEFASDHIRVNAVLPGGVNTEGARASTNGKAAQGPITQPGRMPLGRIGEPADIANAVLFFASPASSYITGQLLAVDGGFQVS